MKVATYLFFALVLVALMWRCEKYIMDARVDSNPMRRTAQYFDTCSPENVGDCPAPIRPLSRK